MMINKCYILVLVFLLLTACHKNKTNEKEALLIQPRSNDLHLFYQGYIKPIHEQLIISPTIGIISHINFHYGSYVKKGDLLFTIHSPEMENEFRDTISNFFKVKQAYLTSCKNMLGTEMLYKEKIISEQEYLSEQSQHQANYLNYLDAQRKLKQYQFFFPSYEQNIVNQSFTNLEDLKNILQQNLNDITVFSPSSGIILFPEDKNSNNNKLLQVGARIKKEDILLDIGDLSGLSVTTYVPENEINHLALGMPASLTFSSSFEIELTGRIVSIAKQAINSETNDFTLFPVDILVQNITSNQLKQIRIGMHTKIDILIKQPSTITIPISAVFQKDNKDYVTLINPLGKKIDRAVKTGATSLSDVTILNGLKSGDRILLGD